LVQFLMSDCIVFYYASVRRLTVYTYGLVPQQPVILTGTDLVAPALRWNLSYLEENVGSSKHTVYISKSKMFLYFDDKKVGGIYLAFIYLSA